MSMKVKADLYCKFEDMHTTALQVAYKAVAQLFHWNFENLIR